MNTTAYPIHHVSTSFVIQEERANKVLLYLSIPVLRVRRSFRKEFQYIPLNAHNEVIEFQNQSFTFTIQIENKLYSMLIARLPGLIQPKQCSITYEMGGCWITLVKLIPTSWIDKVRGDLYPPLDV